MSVFTFFFQVATIKRWHHLSACTVEKPDAQFQSSRGRNDEGNRTRYSQDGIISKFNKSCQESEYIMQPPIGISDFRKLIETKDFKGQQYLFVDKSLFIKEILDDLAEVKLITRPRRFGKTLNMTMLHHFLASEVNDQPTQHLFNGLKISHHQEYIEKYQGKYPVIYITFKDIVKENSYAEAYKRLCDIISQSYSNHQYLLSSSSISDYEKKRFESILEERPTETNLKSSLLDLTRALALHHNVKPWVLIDEYDTPIQTAYFGGYYKQMVETMRAFLGSGLKDNPYLEKALLTGILRVTKESLFSTLNNVISYSLLHPRYAEYFGFTESEVMSFLGKIGFNDHINSIRDWYNGYQIGGTTLVYNPWSIVNYIKENGRFGHYWINTGDNQLIKKLVIQSSDPLKMQLESLFRGNLLERSVDENIIFENLETSDSAIWTLLMMTGYLKAEVCQDSEKGIYRFGIPNREVKDLYQKMIAEWLSGVNDSNVFNNFLKDLLQGNMVNFENNLKRILMQTFSVNDIKGKEPEKFFHGFMLGLLSGIDSRQYQIQSNKESGYGRFDIAIIPKDPSKFGIVIEVKSVNTKDLKNLEKIAIEALNQIDRQQYATILTENQVKDQLKIGVAFCGKELVVEHQMVSVV